jgi:serine/threonine protein kinase
MRHATQSNGAQVVVKLLHPDSNELGILQDLHSNKSPFNHTIHLLGTLKLNMWTFIFLSEATPLDLGFALGMFQVRSSTKVVRFSRQLLEGVAFLHRHDIKPQNIVTISGQLFIISLSVSMAQMR